MAYFNQVGIKDGANLDAFSRLRVSNPTYLFDAQFTYDLRPLLFEQIISGSGAAAAHDSTNRCATLTFSSTPTGGKAFMQSYEWTPYQPGRSQLAFVTFNFNSGVANVLKFAGIGDGVNGVQLEMNGTALQASLYSGTTNGNQTIAQASFNLDKLDGTGRSGYTFDASKVQILVIDYQALYVGRVRLGLDIDGAVIYFHEFKHANRIAYPYIQIASLPIRCGMTCTGTVSTTMSFICSSVTSEGGNLDEAGIPFSFEAITAAATSIPNGTPLHLMSLRPRATFNSIVNRTHIHLTDLDVYVHGNTAIKIDVLIGQALSGTTTFNNVNTNYSAMEYNTAGTLSGSPTAIIQSFYATGSKNAGGQLLTQKIPLTLDAAGAARVNGTVTIQATGCGGTSGCYLSANWVEVR